MNIEEIKNRVNAKVERGKDFIKDHKDEIVITFGVTAVTLTGGLLIHKHVSVRDVSNYSRMIKSSAKTVKAAIENSIPSGTGNPESVIVVSKQGTAKIPHLRKGFYRKLQKGHRISIAKLDYAAKNNIIIPEGYTYVNPTYIHKKAA